MNPSQLTPEQSNSPFARLQQLVRARKPQERCELCGCAIGEEHHHLLDLNNRQLVCACQACAILFAGDHHQRYRRVHSRVQLLTDLQMSDELWDSLHIPINLAFFYRSTQANKVIAMYPSPAGVTESLLPTDAWGELTSMSPALRNMQGDVEALLVNHLKNHNDCFLVSIDECYKLTGLIRSNWRGLSGGAEVWQAINEFFDGLHRRASRNGGAGGA